MAQKISALGIVVRFIVAVALVTLTWNPSDINFFDWAIANWAELKPVIVFVGLVLLIAWIVFLRATTRSLGPIGMVLAVALAGSILWLILDYGLVDPANRQTLSWVVLILLSAILAAGMSWSHLRRRMAGQTDVDDITE